jgi:hypothetical protein
MASQRNYAVGYGKPPKHSRWQKGQSGNPKGRPRRNRDVSALIATLLDQRIVVRKGKTTKRMRRLDHLLDRIFENALAGDPRLIRMLLDEAHKSETRREKQEPHFEAADREVIAAVLKRLGVATT